MKKKYTLSSVEIDILQLLAEELTVDQVADCLHLKKDNVCYHCREIRKLTGKHTAFGAYRVALQNGWILLK